MSLASIPLIELSQTELNVAAAQLDHPSVKKYLISIIRPLVVDIVLNGDAPDPKSGETLEAFQIRVSKARGAVEALEELLQISAVQTDESVNS